MSDFISILREREVPDWLRAGYALVFLVTFAHAVVTKDALTCCPPGYTDADIFTFVQCGQAAGIWTLTIIAIVEVATIMVFMVPKVYYGIKGKGRAEGIAEGIEKGERAERERIAAALDAAGITDPETRRIVMNGRRNGN